MHGFLVLHDIQTARRALDAIIKAVDFLREYPFTCRKADDNPFLRELIIPFD